MANIIVANGLFPQSEHVIEIINNADKIICCDGAINNLLKHHIVPDVIIGDLDSISGFAKNEFAGKIVHISDQNTNDLTKAVNWCKENKIDDIIIVGATGKREDHAIANISLLMMYSDIVKNIKIVSDYGEFVPFNKSCNCKSFKGQQISIFSFNPDMPVSSKNLKYPLNELKLKYPWQGTLNECLYDNFSLDFENGKLIVYFLY